MDISVISRVFGSYLESLWDMMFHMAPYLLVGFAVAALLHVYVRREFVERHLGGRGIWPVLKGTLLGAPMPLCSCSVIPVAAGLRKQGASRGAVTSFLISTPQTGADNIALTWGMLGPVVGIFSPIAAVVTGISGGLLANLIKEKGDSLPATTSAAATAVIADACQADDDCAHCESPAAAELPAESAGQKFLRGLRYGFLDLPRDLASTFIFGLLIAALIVTVVPPGYFGRMLPSGILQMLAMLLVSVPMYVCATSSVPLAAAFILSGVSPGAAIVFLIAGPATNAASITTISRILGLKTTLIYVGTIIVGALASGLLLNGMISSIPYASAQSHAGHGAHASSSFSLILGHSSAVVLSALLLSGLLPRRRRAAAPAAALPAESEAVISIEGMTCNHCVEAVSSALSAQPGVRSVDVDLKQGRAHIVGQSFSLEALLAAVRRLGYSARPGQAGR